jgi:hypothetical protein
MPPKKSNKSQDNTDEFSSMTEAEKIAEIIQLRKMKKEFEAKIQREIDRNDATVHRIRTLLDKEYRRRCREANETQRRRAERRRRRDNNNNDCENSQDREEEEKQSDGEDGEDGDDDKKHAATKQKEKLKRKRQQQKDDQDTTIDEIVAKQRKENRWKFDLPDTLPISRQNLALFNLVQSLKEAQDAGVCVFRVLDWVRSGFVPDFGEADDDAATEGNPRLMPIRTKDGKKQVDMIEQAGSAKMIGWKEVQEEEEDDDEEDEEEAEDDEKQE